MMIIMANKKTTETSKWYKLEVIFKGLGLFFITGAVTIYGIYSESKKSDIAQASRKSQMVIETMNHRETAAAAMRAQMFNTLMAHYFKECGDPNTQIIILELIGLNFQDHLHMKPLFEKLDAEVKGQDEKRKALRKAAKHIRRNEINKIVGSEGEVIKLALAENDACSVEPYTLINLTLRKVEEDRIRVSSDPDDATGFEVTYYDMPLTDNTRLGELTYSVLLSGTDKKGHKASVEVVILPKHYYNSRDNLRFDDLIGQLMLRRSYTE
jgi:hypothetical protein